MGPVFQRVNGASAILMLTIQILATLGSQEYVCREQRFGYFNRSEFHQNAFYWCFFYINQREIQGNYVALANSFIGLNQTVQAVRLSEEYFWTDLCSRLSPDLFPDFRTVHELCDRWQKCTRKAIACCEEQTTLYQTPAKNRCPATWDGYGCWGEVKAGSHAEIFCPTFVPSFIASNRAVRECTASGTWYRKEDPQTNISYEWTDYRDCSDRQVHLINVYISIGCNALSVLLLLPAVMIFMTVPLRKEERIRVHTNFFLALLLSSTVRILREMLITYDFLISDNNAETRMEQNSVGCRVLMAVQLYCTGTTFAWMFCEGYYLHTLISHALSPNINVKWLYVGGWVAPMLPTLAYCIVRAILDNVQCWALINGEMNWITDAPNLFCIVANIYFLVSIARSIKRLREHPQEESARSKRICRAVVILFLLFGLQWIIQIAILPKGTPGEAEYIVFATTVRNSQGFLVAVIFCFGNSEVQASVRDSQLWRTLRRLSRESRHSVLTQMSVLSGRSSAAARGHSVNSEAARDNSIISEAYRATTSRPDRDLNTRSSIGNKREGSPHVSLAEDQNGSRLMQNDIDSTSHSVQRESSLTPSGPTSYRESTKKGYTIVATTEPKDDEIHEYISQI